MESVGRETVEVWSQMLREVKLAQVGVLVYGAVYFFLVSTMEANNLSQSYPLIYVGLSMIAQTLVVVGILLFGLGRSKEVTKIWRWVFPMLILDVVVGVGLDAMVPPDFEVREWLLSEAFSIWFIAPAYYINFRVATHRESE
jgi:multidrug transporter EmrE-like cation transporter